MAPCSLIEIYRRFGDRCVSPLVHEDCKFISEYRSYISDDSSIQCQPREKLEAHNYVTPYSLVQHTLRTQEYIFVSSVERISHVRLHTVLYLRQTDRKLQKISAPSNNAISHSTKKKSYQQSFRIFPRS